MELILGDLLDQLGHDLRITIEYVDALGLQKISMSGAKFEGKQS